MTEKWEDRVAQFKRDKDATPCRWRPTDRQILPPTCRPLSIYEVRRLCFRCATSCSATVYNDHPKCLNNYSCNYSGCMSLPKRLLAHSGSTSSYCHPSELTDSHEHKHVTKSLNQRMFFEYTFHQRHVFERQVALTPNLSNRMYRCSAWPPWKLRDSGIDPCLP